MRITTIRQRLTAPTFRQVGAVSRLRSWPMDEATRKRVTELLSKTIAELTVGEAVWLALTIDGADMTDDEIAELVAPAE